MMAYLCCSKLPYSFMKSSISFSSACCICFNFICRCCSTIAMRSSAFCAIVLPVDLPSLSFISVEVTSFRYSSSVFVCFHMLALRPFFSLTHIVWSFFFLASTSLAIESSMAFFSLSAERFI